MRASPPSPATRRSESSTSSRAAPSGGSRSPWTSSPGWSNQAVVSCCSYQAPQPSRGHWDGSRRSERPNGWSSGCWERGLLSGPSTAGEPPVVVVPDPSAAAEAGRDAVLGRLVAGAGAGGEAGDAGQGLVEGGAAALPFGPELEEAGLGDAGPVRPERGDVGGELAQGALDGGRPGVELGRDLLELFGGDPDAGGGHGAPPECADAGALMSE